VVSVGRVGREGRGHADRAGQRSGSLGAGRHDGRGRTGAARAFAEYSLIRRNGSVVGFEPAKISVAMTKAFLAVSGNQAAASARIRDIVGALTTHVVTALRRRQPHGGTFHIEDVQDQVELALMRSGEHDVARAYVLYREERARARAQEKAARDPSPATPAVIHVLQNGIRKPLDQRRSPTW
jgi:ribonucleoside-diphosphate reductase alpha chain